ncbi:MAG TPA: hypothetical protein VIB39_12085 [Candidatus Angelobacter sp.]|jgi:hypothetical protein
MPGINERQARSGILGISFRRKQRTNILPAEANRRMTSQPRHDRAWQKSSSAYASNINFDPQL